MDLDTLTLTRREECTLLRLILEDQASEHPSYGLEHLRLELLRQVGDVDDFYGEAPPEDEASPAPLRKPADPI